MKPLIFIVGGSQGLGQALCQEYLDAGWEVTELSRNGQGQHHINCDLSNVEVSNQTFETLFKSQQQTERPRISLIINAASITPIGNIAETSSKDIIQHLNTNINSAVLLIHQFSKAFQKHQAKKTLAYISSGAARRNIEGMSLYCASKAALERLVLTFHQEQQKQKHPINAMVINPGVMDTDMQVTIRQQKKKDFPLLDHWQQLHQKGKLADATTVAKICHNLLESSDHEPSYHVAQDYI